MKHIAYPSASRRRFRHLARSVERETLQHYACSAVDNGLGRAAYPAGLLYAFYPCSGAPAAYQQLTQFYRILRVLWIASTFPLHLCLVGFSLVPLLPGLLPDALVPGKQQQWTLPQRVVYPLLRRLIWAVCDVGSPGTLTPSARRGVPWWAWALEEFTVRVGRAARVDLDVTDAVLPDQARRDGWISGDVLDPAGVIGFEAVPCFWFERHPAVRHSAGFRAKDVHRWSARNKRERVILYFVGGGFVTGNPAEGSRCFKLARETGLRVVGANFRKATTATQAFPAALQDAVTVYAHLVLDLGYQDIVLAGDSAGGSLAVMLTQYLATLGPRWPRTLVLPSALLLLSPWCDLTASTYAVASRSRFEDDIICASMATNSINSFLVHINSTQVRQALAARGQAKRGDGDDSVYVRGAQHPFLSPALPTALSSLTRTARAYLSAGRGPTDNSRLEESRPLRVLVTTGSAELFHLEILHLADRLRDASRAAAVGEPEGVRPEPFVVELVSAEGEVHAFPLVPEWVSPAAGKAWGRMREWLLEGTGKEAQAEALRAGRSSCEVQTCTCM